MKDRQREGEKTRERERERERGGVVAAYISILQAKHARENESE